jgi:hypothetical protein
MKRIKREVDRLFQGFVADRLSHFVIQAPEHNVDAPAEDVIDIAPLVKELEERFAGEPAKLREVQAVAQGYVAAGGVSYGFARRMRELTDDAARLGVT